MEEVLEHGLADVERVDVEAVRPDPDTAAVVDLEIGHLLLGTVVVEVDLSVRIRRQLQRGVGEDPRPGRLPVIDRDPPITQPDHAVSRAAVTPLAVRHHRLRQDRLRLPLIQEPHTRLDMPSERLGDVDLIALDQLLGEAVHFGAAPSGFVAVGVASGFERVESLADAEFGEFAPMIHRISCSGVGRPVDERGLREAVADEGGDAVGFLPVEEVGVSASAVDPLEAHSQPPIVALGCSAHAAANASRNSIAPS